MTSHTMKRLALALNDVMLLTVSFFASCHLTGYPFYDLYNKWILGGIIVSIQLYIFLRFGLYRAILKYANIDFVITVMKAVTTANLLLIFGFYFFQIRISNSTLVINWILNVALIGGSRLFVRYYYELKHRFQMGKKVLIYGAGDMGVLALRQLKMSTASVYSPVGFIDDDNSKHNRIIHGVRVVGTYYDLEEIVDKYRVDEVLVAIAGIDGSKLRDIVKKCRNKNIVCRILPCFTRLLEIESDLRAIELSDLMRRAPKDLDDDAIRNYICNQVVLVTGAAGSIGSEIIKQCLTYAPKRLIALDQSEYGLYALREDLGDNNVKYILCDTTNRQQLESVMRERMPSVVFHAAAYKHVPLLEDNLFEALRNNILSTKYLCELSDQYNVRSFVMISTDKAVKPSSIMGVSKRICELIVQNFENASNTVYVAVRFGNVLGSSGSVVPKFMKQIRMGGPVTVTHPETTRYFMLIDEAVKLVLQAATIGKGREIFILDMGEPVKMLDMAENLIYLMGRQPHRDIKIEFTGLRPGEKLYEELFSDEIESKTRFKEIMIGKPRVYEWKWLDTKLDELMDVSFLGSKEKAIILMSELVPEANFFKKLV